MGIAGAIVLGAGLALAACGGSGATTASPGGASLCGQVSSVVRLVVDRHDAFPTNHFVYSFPSRVVVNKPTSARAAATALCQLPVPPSGDINCPIDYAITYSLKFSLVDGATLPPVVVGATGCQTVSGAGLRRWLLTSHNGFWTTLGRAMGLPHPSDQWSGGAG
jgi:hypothetical protein